MAITNLDQYRGTRTKTGHGAYLQTGGNESLMNQAYNSLNPGQLFIRNGKVWVLGQGGTAREAKPAEIAKAGGMPGGMAGGSLAYQGQGGMPPAPQQDPQQTIKDALAEYRRATEEAKQANLARYNQGMGMHEGLRRRVMGLQKGQGAQQRADLHEQYRKERAAYQQSAISRGAASPALMSTMNQGSMRREQESANRLNEALRREHIGYDMSLQNNQLGFLERRNDIGPDPALYARLMQSLGQGQGELGQGGAGGLGAMTQQRIKASTRPNRPVQYSYNRRVTRT